MRKFKQFVKGTTLSQEEWEEEVFGPEQIDEILRQVKDPEGVMRWAIVSKKTGRPLVYYKGEGKPSDEWFKDQERRIQYFKHRG